MLGALALLLLLVALNGLFVAAEFAIVKVRYSQIETEAAQGSLLARSVLHIRDNIDAYVSASQLGITLASLALGWLGEPIIAELLEATLKFFGLEVDPAFAHQIAVPIGFVVITLCHLIFGEVIPKYIAIAYPLGTAYTLSIPLTLFALVFRPLVWFVREVSRATLKLFGIELDKEQESHTEDELRLLLAQSAQSGEQGTIRQAEHELIEKVFNFEDRIVRQIMVPRTNMMAVAVDAPIEDIFDTIVGEGYTRMPVYSGTRDNIVGVVHTKDLLRPIRENKHIHIQEFLRPAYFVPETKRISELLKEFQLQKIHMAVVVDEFGVTSGLVTLEDIVEELVGEIQDEYDEEAPVVEKKSDSSFVVNAHAAIIDVNKSLPVPLPEGADYATLAGLINVIFGLIPDVGQTKVFERYQFTILRRSKRSVDSALLELLPEASGEEESDKEEDRSEAA